MGTLLNIDNIEKREVPLLNKLAKHIHSNAKAKGFWEEMALIDMFIGNENDVIRLKKAIISQKIMLVVSELGEAIEALRNDKMCPRGSDKTLMEMIKADVDKFGFETIIKDTFEDEIADTIIRILDLCGYMDIDIDFHIRAKMHYNAGRERLHGKEF